MIEFELVQWRDGTISLTFEDRMEGKDRHFALLEDGTAQEVLTDEEGENETRRPINLIIELRKMLQEQSQ